MSLSTSVPRNRLLAALAQEDLGPLLPHLQLVELKQRLILYEVGAAIEYVYFIETGLASVLTTMADGASVEVGMIGFEGLVGVPVLLGDEKSTQHVVMQLPGTALRMSAARCKAAFNKNPAFRAVVLRFLNAFLSLGAQTAACNRLHSVEQRCARWLLMSRDRAESDALPLTHEFLSAMLGVRRAGVSETAKDLQHSGLITYHRGKVKITDRAGLQAAACECYGLDLERFNRLLQLAAA